MQYGPRGISVLAAFDDSKKGGLAIPQVVCLERHITPGRFWNLAYKTGVY